MTEIRQYTVSVCSAGIFFALLLSLMQGKGLTATITRHVCGVIMAFLVISPLKQIKLTNFTEIYGHYLLDAQVVAAMGEEQAADAMEDIIKQQAEAYILDKAQAMGVVLEVEIRVSGEDLPVPVSVRIDGSVPPFAKLRLQQILAEELGIAKENQLWSG